MGLEVSLIFALAEGNFHIKNTKKATLGTSSKRSQNRTLKRHVVVNGQTTNCLWNLCDFWMVQALLLKNILSCHHTWSLLRPHKGLADIYEAW